VSSGTIVLITLVIIIITIKNKNKDKNKNKNRVIITTILSPVTALLLCGSMPLLHRECVYDRRPDADTWQWWA
jgi:hypothetical protein